MDWAEYEKQKQLLQAQTLSPNQYEQMIKRIVKELENGSKTDNE